MLRQLSLHEPDASSNGRVLLVFILQGHQILDAQPRSFVGVFILHHRHVRSGPHCDASPGSLASLPWHHCLSTPPAFSQYLITPNASGNVAFACARASCARTIFQMESFLVHGPVRSWLIGGGPLSQLNRLGVTVFNVNPFFNSNAVTFVGPPASSPYYASPAVGLSLPPCGVRVGPHIWLRLLMVASAPSSLQWRPLLAHEPGSNIICSPTPSSTWELYSHPRVPSSFHWSHRECCRLGPCGFDKVPPCVAYEAVVRNTKAYPQLESCRSR